MLKSVGQAKFGGPRRSIEDASELPLPILPFTPFSALCPYSTSTLKLTKLEKGTVGFKSDPLTAQTRFKQATNWILRRFQLEGLQVGLQPLCSNRRFRMICFPLRRTWNTPVPILELASALAYRGLLQQAVFKHFPLHVSHVVTRSVRSVQSSKLQVATTFSTAAVTPPKPIGAVKSGSFRDHASASTTPASRRGR
jgi:hypothetical protein